MINVIEPEGGYVWQDSHTDEEKYLPDFDCVMLDGLILSGMPPKAAAKEVGLQWWRVSEEQRQAYIDLWHRGNAERTFEGAHDRESRNTYLSQLQERLVDLAAAWGEEVTMPAFHRFDRRWMKA